MIPIALRMYQLKLHGIYRLRHHVNNVQPDQMVTLVALNTDPNQPEIGTFMVLKTCQLMNLYLDELTLL